MTSMSQSLHHIKKFFKKVEIQKLANSLYTITLDSKNIRTKEKNIITTSSYELA